MVALNSMIPETMKEALTGGMDSDDDEAAFHEEGFLNSVYLDRVTISPLTLKPAATVSRISQNCLQHSHSRKPNAYL